MARSGSSNSPIPRTIPLKGGLLPRLRPDPIETGRVGALALGYERQNTKTILSRFRSNSPWHLFPPIDLDGSGVAYTLLVNPSGGLVGGDELSIRAQLGPKTHVLISTPSANRVYRSLDKTAIQSVDLNIGSGAILEWVPQVTIPFAGSRFHQKIDVVLQPGATLLLWDALASGRIARRERWAFSTLENEITIRTPSGAWLYERYRLGEEAVGLVRPWDYVGTLYVLGDAITSGLWKTIEEKVVGVLDARSGRILGGVSEPAAGGRVVKLLARSAPDFQDAFEAVWGEVRRLLWRLPVPELRCY